MLNFPNQFTTIGFTITAVSALVWWWVLQREIAWGKVVFVDWFMPVMLTIGSFIIVLTPTNESKEVCSLIFAGFSSCVAIVCFGVNMEDNFFKFIRSTYLSSRDFK